MIFLGFRPKLMQDFHHQKVGIVDQDWIQRKKLDFIRQGTNPTMVMTRPNSKLEAALSAFRESKRMVFFPTQCGGFLK